MRFECRMIRCSNQKSVGNRELLKDGVLYINKFFYFNSIKSSCIKNISFQDNIITINTEYTFIELNDD